MSTKQATTRNMKNQIKNLWDDAHTLRGDSRITFGEAVEKYGAAVVKRAMESGKVSVTWIEMLTPLQAGDVNAYAGMTEGPEKERIKSTPRPYARTDFSYPANPELKMQANGEQIG